MSSRGWMAAVSAAGCLLLAAKKPTDDTSNPAYRTPAFSIPVNTTGKPAPPAGFIHPGVLVNRAQLDEIKRRVAAGITIVASAPEMVTMIQETLVAIA